MATQITGKGGTRYFDRKDGFYFETGKDFKIAPGAQPISDIPTLQVLGVEGPTGSQGIPNYLKRLGVQNTPTEQQIQAGLLNTTQAQRDQAIYGGGGLPGLNFSQTTPVDYGLKPDFSTITSQALTPAAGTQFRTVPEADTLDITKLDTTQLSQPEKQASQMNQRLRSLMSEVEGERGFQLGQETMRGVPELARIQRDLSSQLQLSQLEATTIQAETQKGEGVPSAISKRQMAEKLRKNTVKSLQLYAQLQMANGNLLAAQDAADRATEMKFGPIKDRIKTLQTNLQLIQNDPAYDEAIQQRRAARQAMTDQAESDVKRSEDIYSSIQNLTLNNEYLLNAPPEIKKAVREFLDINPEEELVTYEDYNRILGLMSPYTTKPEELNNQIVGSAETGYQLVSYDNQGNIISKRPISGGSGGATIENTAAVNLYSGILQQAMNEGATPQEAVMSVVTFADSSGTKLNIKNQNALLQWAKENQPTTASLKAPAVVTPEKIPIFKGNLVGDIGVIGQAFGAGLSEIDRLNTKFVNSITNYLFGR